MDGSMEIDDVVRNWSELFFGTKPDREIGKVLQAMLKSKLGPDLQVHQILNKVDSKTLGRRDLPEISTLIVPKEIENIDDPRLRIPLQMLFMPTLDCTQKCSYCYSTESYSDNIKALEFKRIQEIMEEAKRLGMHTIDLSGGEPVSYRHFFPLLEKLFELGLEVNLPTKYPLSREDVKRRKAIGLKTIQISIVYSCAIVIWNNCILGFANVQCSDIVCQNMLKEIPSVISSQDKPTHVRYVEQASIFSCGKMLFDDALPVIQGHHPPGKFHHLCP